MELGKPYSYFLEKKGASYRPRALTARDVDLLDDLVRTCLNHEKNGWRHGWAKPLDLGGGDCTHHSQTLKKLWKAGMVERTRGSGGRHYRPTDAGKAVACLARIFPPAVKP